MLNPYEHVVATPDPEMPLGYCAILVNRRVVYSGRIARCVPFLRSGAVLVLHPDDFADGQAFMKKQVN